MTGWARHALAITVKDLRRDVRGRDDALATFVLALLFLLVFAFALDAGGETARRAAPGMLWVAIVFAGTSVAGRAFAGELDRGTLDGLLLAPVDRGAIYAGKFLGVLLEITAVEAIVVPASAVLFNLPVLTPGALAAIAAGTVGFAALATLVAAVAAGTRARAALLPVLLLPCATPLLIAGIRATDLALGGDAAADPYPWLSLAIAAGVAYVGAGLLLIDHLLEDTR